MLCGIGVIAYLVATPSVLKSARPCWSYSVVAVVIALAVLALVTDPVSHLRAEAGGDQWFVATWPL